MECNQIFFAGHAVRRMFRRSIKPIEVQEVLLSGEIIEDYPDEQPLPSSLMLGFVENRPLHLVVAIEESTKCCYIITAYVPDPAIWEADFRARRI